MTTLPYNLIAKIIRLIDDDWISLNLANVTKDQPPCICMFKMDPNLNNKAWSHYFHHHDVWEYMKRERKRSQKQWWVPCWIRKWKRKRWNITSDQQSFLRCEILEDRLTLVPHFIQNYLEIVEATKIYPILLQEFGTLAWCQLANQYQKDTGRKIAYNGLHHKLCFQQEIFRLHTKLYVLILDKRLKTYQQGQSTISFF